MRFFLNLLWIVFGGGFVIWLEYMLVGLLLCMTIVGIPFGVQCFKVASLGFLPFGKDIVEVPRSSEEGDSTVTLAMNILWFLAAGIWIFLSHLGLALACALTLIGLPFALQHLKLAVLALAPFGKTICRI